MNFSPAVTETKAGWQARHNSSTDDTQNKTDTLTTMNVVYKFK